MTSVSFAESWNLCSIAVPDEVQALCFSCCEKSVRGCCSDMALQEIRQQTNCMAIVAANTGSKLCDKLCFVYLDIDVSALARSKKVGHLSSPQNILRVINPLTTLPRDWLLHFL